MVTINIEQLVEQLHGLDAQIKELLAISGSPGLSLGVVHEGNTIYTAHFGRRDIRHRSAPNDDTIYRVASFSKPLTVGAVASLVSEGVLDWNVPICEYIPEFRERRDDAGQKTTLVDLLSNRVGLTPANALWGQKNGVFLMPKDEIVRTACFLELAKPFRSAFVYGNWTYGLASEIIERVTGKSFGTFVQERLLYPLGMQRTTFGMPNDENMASSHAIMNNGIACTLPFFNYSDQTGLAGGGAGKSTISDLLRMYKSILSAYNHQREAGLISILGSPFT